MCLGCHAAMPLTGYHKTSEFNQLHERTMCHAPIHHADACFFYERLSPYSRLIHAAKYESRPSIGRLLAKDHARITAPTGFFRRHRPDSPGATRPSQADTPRLQPEPPHSTRHIGHQPAYPSAHCSAHAAHPSQTSKNAAGRLDNARGTFSVGQRKMLPAIRTYSIVDDIITTGSTLCACAKPSTAHRHRPPYPILTLAATRLS